MKLLMISTDHRLFMAEDLVARQKGYFEGHEVTVWILTDKVQGEKTVDGIRLIATGGTNKFSSLWRGYRMAFSDMTDYRFVTTQDVLFTGLLGWFLAKKKSIPFFVQLHGDYLDNPLWIKQRRLNVVLNALGKALLKRATAIRVVSARIKDDIVPRYGIDASHVLSLPICTDLSTFSAQGSSEANKRNLFFVGRLIEEKDPLLFCRVAARVMKDDPTVNAVIAGEGVLMDAMREVFAKAGLSDRARFLGNVNAGTLTHWYRSSIALVHTAPWEGWGMPMIESIACGCPVVTTDTGCAGEAIRHEKEGLVYAVGDEEGLYQGTKKLCEDQAYRDALAANGITEAQNWSYDARKGDLMNFYQRYL
ncbi:MAG: glycosyltransferase family 4 protein [Patescibacteria group bacterium]